MSARHYRRLLPLLVLLAGCDDGPMAPRAGTLRLSLAMSGLDLDQDGALISVDGAPPVAVPPSGAIALDLKTGRHTLDLSGLSANCVPTGAASQEVRIRDGDLLDVAFPITCTAANGVIEVSITTTGQDLDPDGYLVVIDNGPAQRVPSGTVARFSPVAGGTRTVKVLDIASNCVVSGANPVMVQVSTGGTVRDTVPVAAAVSCASKSGSLLVYTTTAGPEDPDGYILALGPAPLQNYRLGANDSLLITGVLVGSHPLAWSDLAGNCAAVGSPPASVNIASAGTSTVQFSANCVTPAVLRVTAPTTGTNPDPGYLVRVDGGASFPLLAGAQLSLDLLAGSHSVELTDVAPNCAVGATNPVSVTLSTAAPTDLSFPVSCVSTPRTGMNITVVTTGNAPDDGYQLDLMACFDIFTCAPPSASPTLPANGAVQVDLPDGLYFGNLKDVAPNCRYTSSPGVLGGLVVQGQLLDVRIDVTCYARADFAVTVAASGSDLPSSLVLRVDGTNPVIIPVGVSFQVSSLEGVRSIHIENIPENCQVTSPNPTSITLVAGVVAPVSFTLTCQPFAVVNVSVSTTGTSIPANYLVGVDPDFAYYTPYWPGYQYTTQITPNGSVSIKLRSGSHTIWLDQVTSNCTRSGPNPATVQGTFGAVIDVAYTVVCQ